MIKPILKAEGRALFLLKAVPHLGPQIQLRKV